MFGSDTTPASRKRVPIIDITDLYHPAQDPGDNVDLIAAFALPEVDLRAVVFDVTDSFRKPVADHPGLYADPNGPRECGVIPLTQLNYIFGRNVPWGAGPFTMMRSPTDTMPGLPEFQQRGVDLIHRVLRESREKVEIVSFGSARPLAVAFNRNPDLLRKKVARIHLCAGASSDQYLEWNVALDPHAMVCLLRSGLPIALYPCATEKGPFALGEHNCYWSLPDLKFIQSMAPSLRRYLQYALEPSKRVDFLRTLDQDSPIQGMEERLARPHNVWETAVWMQVARRELVRRPDGSYRIIPRTSIQAEDAALTNELLPGKLEVNEKGLFRFEVTQGKSNILIYHRNNPELNQAALREAFPAWYGSIKP